MKGPSSRGFLALLLIGLACTLEVSEAPPRPGPDAPCSEAFEYDQQRCPSPGGFYRGACVERATARFHECLVERHGPTAALQGPNGTLTMGAPLPTEP